MSSTTICRSRAQRLHLTFTSLLVEHESGHTCKGLLNRNSPHIRLREIYRCLLSSKGWYRFMIVYTKRQRERLETHFKHHFQIKTGLITTFWKASHECILAMSALIFVTHHSFPHWLVIRMTAWSVLPEGSPFQIPDYLRCCIDAPGSPNYFLFF